MQSILANLRRLFLQAQSVVFESTQSVEALEQAIRASMVSKGNTQGLVGKVGGGRAQLNWSFAPMRYPNSATFVARIAPTSTGSRITGSMETSLFNQCVAVVWLGGVTIISLVFVWTIFMPAAGFLLFWLGTWIFTLGEAKTEENICASLARICEAASESKA